MRGFSTIEVLVALMLLSTLVIAALLLSLGAPQVLRSAREHHEALAAAEAALMREERRALDAFSTIISYSTTTEEGYALAVDATLLPDEATKRVRATLSWQGAGGRPHATTLTTYLTDYLHAGDYSCDVLPRGRWESPQASQRSLSPGDLLPEDWTLGTAATDGITATRQHLALWAGATAVGNAPSFFLFSLADGEPTYVSSLATSSTTAAVSAVALTQQYAYAASASTCATAARCGQLKIIDLSQPDSPRILSQLLLPRSAPPYAGDATGPVAATSIFYRDGYVYLGLEQTPSTAGQEFNIIDVRDPAHPVWIGGFRVGRTVNDMYVRDGRAYLATNARATADVLVLEVTDPAHIQEIARAALPPLQPTSTFGYAHVLGLYGDELHVGRSYVSNADEWVLMGAMAPELPVRMSRDLGTLFNPASARALILREAQAFVLLPRALEVWDRSDPLAPYRRASVAISGDATDAACVGNEIYVVSTDGGVGLLTRITSL